MTLGDALGHLNILMDIGIFKFEYPESFLDIQNFLDIQLCDIGDAPRHLNILKDIGIIKFEYPEIFLDIRNFLDI